MIKCPECGWIGKEEDLKLFSHIDDPPGVCPDCWKDGQDMMKIEPTYPKVNCQPSKPWSPCTGKDCKHPSHNNLSPH